MFRSILANDWKKSPAHLLLLSKFLKPAVPGKFFEKDEWNRTLSETPKKAIKRMVDDGMVVQANISDIIDAKYKASELKEMLIQRKLPATGRKDELISKLIQVDRKSMEKLTQGIQVYVCSEKGHQIAEQFLAQENDKRTNIEQEVMKALQDGNFKNACLLTAEFEATQVFWRGYNIDWKNYKAQNDVSKLKIIFTKTSGILESMQPDKLKQLRILAGMMLLWGENTADKWIDKTFETGISLDIDSAARILIALANNQISLQEFRKGRMIGKVKVYGVNDKLMCSECKRLMELEFSIDEAPELPHAKCTSKVGCRCYYHPVFSEELFKKELDKIFND